MATELTVDAKQDCACACEGNRARRTGRVVGRMVRVIELAVADADLTLSQYRLLALLDYAGCDAASSIAEKLRVSRPSITGVVDGLVARGLAQRRHGDQDRRRVDIELTDAGRELLNTADAAIEQRIDRIEELIGELRA